MKESKKKKISVEKEDKKEYKIQTIYYYIMIILVSLIVLVGTLEVIEYKRRSYVNNSIEEILKGLKEKKVDLGVVIPKFNNLMDQLSHIEMENLNVMICKLKNLNMEELQENVMKLLNGQKKIIVKSSDDSDNTKIFKNPIISFANSVDVNIKDNSQDKSFGNSRKRKRRSRKNRRLK